MGFMPLDTYNLAELMPLMMEKKRQEENEIKDTRMRRMLSGGGATSYNDPIKDKVREYTMMRNAQRKADLQDEMEDARSVMGRAGEISKGRVGLPGGAAIGMAQNEGAMAQKGMMGGQRVMGGYGGRGSGFLSPDQASAVEDRYQSYSGGGATQAAQEQAALDQAFSSFAPKNPVDIRMQQPNPSGFSNKEIAQNNMQNEAEFKRLSGEDELIAAQKELAKLKSKGKGGTDKPKSVADRKYNEGIRQTAYDYVDTFPKLTYNVTDFETGKKIPRSLTPEQLQYLTEKAKFAADKGASKLDIKNMTEAELFKIGENVDKERETTYNDNLAEEVRRREERKKLAENQTFGQAFNSSKFRFGR